jgi:mannose-6-phosphate isomerase
MNIPFELTKSLIALNPRNFTSLKRTPWAGTALAKGIKENFADTKTQKIGESWEISCDPEALSSIDSHSSLTLRDLIEADPIGCLSGELVHAGRTNCDILVKLLNADSPLSLQIHPSDHHPSLKSNECGKPESWLVLGAEPGSGLYLGFKSKMTLDTVKSHLEGQTFTPEMLEFVPVKAGDFFEIDPHVPHAIGPGVVLLEPQRITPGKSGKTWRMWDWNRKYNSNGDLDDLGGSPRELHIEQSLSILEPEHQYGSTYVDTLRRAPKSIKIAPGVDLKVFPPNQWYQVATIEMDPKSEFRLSAKCAFSCLTVIAGSGFSSHISGSTCRLNKGQSFFAPHNALPMRIRTNDQKLQISFVFPAGKGVINQEAELLFE